MKNSILNFGQALNKKEQKEISGGFDLVPIQILTCDQVCPTATTQIRCGTHCPGVCDGRGGYYLY